MLLGSGIMAGWWPAGFAPALVVAAAVVAWWASLLLLSRTLANLLGAVATTRFRQLAHAGDDRLPRRTADPAAAGGESASLGLPALGIHGPRGSPHPTGAAG
ncbi:MAG: hypothetical protein R2716_08505 [Microthrixaceae bacterium]